MRPAEIASLPLIALLLAAASAEAGQHNLTSLLRRETSSLAALETLTAQVVRSAEEEEAARDRHTRLEHQLAGTERRLAALSTRTTRRREEIRLRARSLYQLSRGGIVRLVWETASGQELPLRLSAATLILRRELRELEHFRQETALLTREMAELTRRRARMTEIRRQLERKHAQLATARQQLLAHLREVRSSRQLQQQLQLEMSAEQRALLARIGALKWRVFAAGGFAARRGRLPRPVPGPIVGVFGRVIDRESKVEILRQGITLRPPARSPVLAVAAGVVRLAGAVRGFGNLILIEHSDGYFSLYGFLSRLQVREGDQVQTRDELGRAGLDPLTGAAATYFELRHGERPLDPAVWLRR